MPGGLKPDGDWGVHGFDVSRVAEVIVDHHNGRQRRGSGYRIATGAVLTAAHVVADASTVRVRFDADRPGEWSCPATIDWCDPRCDVAVLGMVPPMGVPPVPPAGFGGLGDRRAVVDVAAAGFPRWKLRTGPDGRRFRDLHDALGSAAVLSNRRSGTLEITVAAPGADPDPAVSPWQSMSGAAVWAGDRIVAVVAEHHRREGLGRLTAVRIDHCLRQGVDPVGRDLAAALGTVDPATLPDVVAPPSGWLTSAAYIEQVRDIAPASGLLGRDDELAELVAFCAGNTVYEWWQAGPWTGKTALMATFVLQPPVGVDVVSFFVTSRLAGQSDSTAFTEALIDQLSAIVGTAVPATVTASGRDAQRRTLLRAAAAKLRAAGRHLVVVVDGLDEDTGAVPGSGLPSIASLLPKVPPDGMKILVAGRPDPGVPADVPDDHPLYTCRRRVLAGSDQVARIERLARRELGELLSGDEAHQTVIGLVAASGGGLTARDLEELTGVVRHRLERMLGGVFGRTIAGRPGDRPDVATVDQDQALLFTHETLRVEAISQLGAAMGRYRDRIHVWAEGYRRRGWPDDTPSYLVRGYPQMLADGADVDRLTALASDSDRHALLLGRTGGDAAAVAEIRAAQYAILRHRRRIDDDELVVLARLAIRRDDLLARNSRIPTDLPAVWAALGYTARAEALAHSMDRSTQWPAVVEALAERGEFDRAREVTSAITDPVSRTHALSGLVRVLADADDVQRLEALAPMALEAAETGTQRQWLATLRVLVSALARAGQLTAAVEIVAAIRTSHLRMDMAVTLVSSLSEPRDVEQALALINAVTDSVTDPFGWSMVSAAAAEALIDAGEWGRAAGLIDAVLDHAGTLSDPFERTTALTAVAEDLFLAGEPDRGAAVAARAQEAAESTYPPRNREVALAILAGALGRVGQFDRAERVVDAMSWLEHQLPALIDLIRVELAAGRHDRAADLTARARALAATSVDNQNSARELRRLVAALSIAGSYDWAEEIVTSFPEITDSDRGRDAFEREQALTELGAALVEAGEAARAAGLIDRIEDPFERARALFGLARTAARAGRREDATSLVARATDVMSMVAEVYCRAELLTANAEMLARMGDRDEAASLATRAHRVAVNASHSLGNASGMTAAVQAVAEAGDLDWAQAIAVGITDTRERDTALVAAITVAARAGESKRALDIAAAIDDPRWRARYLHDAVHAVAEAGGHDQAHALAAALGDQEVREAAMKDVVVAMAVAGRLDAAEELADRITDPEIRTRALIAVIEQPATARSRDGAARLAARAEEALGAIEDPEAAATMAFALADAIARTADEARAVAIATQTDPGAQWKVLGTLVGAIAAAGRYGRAQQLAAVAEQHQQWTVLTALTRALAEAGQVDQSQHVADRIADPYERVVALSAVTTATARTGDPDRTAELAAAARAAVDAIDGPHMRQKALLPLAQIYAEAGRYDLAREIANTITYEVDRAAALTGLVDVLAQVGDYERARAVAATVPDISFHRSSVLGKFVRRLIEAGDYEQAELVAVDIPFWLTQATVSAALATALAATGNHDRARRVALAITEPDHRGAALAQLATVAGAPTQALLAEAFVAGPWSAPLAALARLTPSVLHRVVAERTGTT